MRHILLDESVPVGLAESLTSSTGCKVSHVVEIGLGGTPDHQLLEIATGLEVDVLITCDQHMVDQQNLRDISFGIVVICTNNWPIIRNRAAEIVEAAARVEAKTHERILQRAHHTRRTPDAD